MSERPVNTGDYVLVRVQVTHRLNDGYLIASTPGLTLITVHENDVLTVAAVPAGQLEASRFAAVG